MKGFGALLIFGAFLFGAMTVIASSDNLHYVDQSDGCFVAKTYPCALRAIKGNFRIERANQIYVLEQGSAMILKSENEIQLLEGQMWIENASALSIFVSPYFKPKVSGEFWLKKERKTTVISNLNGDLKSIPVGFENWFAGLNIEQKVDSGIIQPIAFDAFASSWARVFSGPKAEKLTRLKAYRDHWKNALTQGTELYSKVIERSMASVDRKNQQVLKRQLSREQEQKALNELYRSKNYLDPDSL